jgi:hypothetical protein
MNTGFEERGSLYFNKNIHIINSHPKLRVRGKVFYIKLFKSIFKGNVFCTRTQIGIKARDNINTIRYFATWSDMSKKER